MNTKVWTKLPNKAVIDKTVSALISNGIHVIVVERGSDALSVLLRMIPEKASIMDGGSTTLKQIGFTDYMNNIEHKWNNLHARIYSENDEVKRLNLRRLAETADYFLGSVNAISIDGKLILADRSGTRVSAYSFAARNVIIVTSANKIVDSVEEGMRRTREYALPLENDRMKKEINSWSRIAKWLIIENEFTKDRITVILITNEQLGF